MKKLFTLLLVTLSFLNVTAQSLDLSSPLPVNAKIKKGVLPNGITYYIYKTDVTKDAASYYIIQNVGSILENDDQQGLAHFLEHMAFNGTKNFPGKEMLNKLQKYGAIFGKNINAYTAYDETVYNLDNIPTNQEGSIDTPLMVLHDWADALLLTDSEIDAERGVIKEEWRTRQDGSMRILNKLLPAKFNNSKYAYRMPIGLMDVVENFKYKSLKDFYHDWYRTDLQAIAVVGDVDVQEIEQKIKKIFSDIKPVENPKKREIVDIPDNKDMIFAMATDKEVASANIQFSINHTKSFDNETVATLKESLYNSMVTTMLNARLREIAQKPESPFNMAGLSYSDFARTKESFSAYIVPKPNMQYDAFKIVMTEINRAVKFGFTKEELDRTIVMFKTHYEQAIANEEDTSHKEIIGTIKSNYLDNETMTDVKQEYEISKIIFNQVTLQDLLNQIKKLYSKENRILTVTGVEGEKNLTEEDAVKIINESENDTNLKAYSDDFKGETLMSGVKINEGKILKEKVNKKIGATTFVLSNGVKVHYKFADHEKNSVQLIGDSDGGISLLPDADLPSAFVMSSLVNMSGYGNYDATKVSKLMAGKTASFGVSLSELSEKVSGFSVTKDVETMLQKMHLQFVNPRFDEDSYKRLVNNLNISLAKKGKELNSIMQDSMEVLIYGKNNPRKRTFNQSFIDDVSFDKIKAIYKDRFKDISDFEFYIVGDVKTEDLKPLLEKYVASIPSFGSKKEKWQDKTVSWVKDTIDNDVYLEMENPKASVNYCIKNDYKYCFKNTYYAKALKDILQLRFTESLREQEGGTYGAGVNAGISKDPKNVASLIVNFDCNPDKVENLIKIMHQEIEKIASGDIKQEDLDKSITNYLKDYKEQREHNSYHVALLYGYFKEGYNLDNPKNSKNIINSIKAKDIQKFASKMMKNAKTFEIVFKPKK